jgi:hypothetical protein
MAMLMLVILLPKRFHPAIKPILGTTGTLVRVILKLDRGMANAVFLAQHAL